MVIQTEESIKMHERRPAGAEASADPFDRWLAAEADGSADRPFAPAPVADEDEPPERSRVNQHRFADADFGVATTENYHGRDNPA
jgi:hypothetical protein